MKNRRRQGSRVSFDLEILWAERTCLVFWINRETPLPHLKRSAGYTYFEDVGDLNLTGSTRMNVNDFGPH
jgi:hypothetical protein